MLRNCMGLDIFSAALLGIIQGFTEWLPISSSGHLVVAQSLLGIAAPPEFDIAIMAGTTLALVIYFQERIGALLRGLLRRERKSIDYSVMIALAGVFTAIIGFAGKSFFKGLFAKPVIVSLLIAVTGIFLLLASRAKEGGVLDLKKASFIGIAQGIAVAPGISRSGSTIGTAVLLGVKPKEAAVFSFLIGAPAMAIASTIEFLGTEGGGILLPELVVGSITAFIAGYVGIGFFMKILEKGKLEWFGYYCVLAGLAFAAALSAYSPN